MGGDGGLATVAGAIADLLHAAEATGLDASEVQGIASALYHAERRRVFPSEGCDRDEAIVAGIIGMISATPRPIADRSAIIDAAVLAGRAGIAAIGAATYTQIANALRCAERMGLLFAWPAPRRQACKPLTMTRDLPIPDWVYAPMGRDRAVRLMSLLADTPAGVVAAATNRLLLTETCPCDGPALSRAHRSKTVAGPSLALLRRIGLDPGWSSGVARRDGGENATGFDGRT